MVMNDPNTRYLRFDFVRGKDVQPLDIKEYEMYFNNEYSTNFEVYICEYPKISKINEDIDDIEVDGRSGSLIIRNGTYKNRSLTFKFKLCDDELFWSRIDDVEEWLFNIKDSRLFYDRKDRCFIVKRVIVGDIAKQVRISGEFEATFICEPFMQDINPSSYTFLENEKTIANIGHFDVEPIVELYGNGNLEIAINGEVTRIDNVTDKVIIDSEFFACINGDYSNKLRDMIGNFPKLSRGDNEITVSNNVTKTNIKFINLYR